ncbi:MAG: ribbon-helix-helix protein, CopG family [Actinomycetota bacterium]
MMAFTAQLLSFSVVVRTQISLEPEQMDRLRELARSRGTSMAALVRQGVLALIEDASTTDRRARARAASGRFCWSGDSRDHDRDLLEAFGG